MTSRPRAAAIAAVLTLGLGLSACSLGASTDDASPAPSGPATGAAGSGTVVLLTHDSFSLPKKLIAAFEQESGYRLEVRSSGDAGVLTSQLVLNADDPVADVAYGVDNTFGSRALDAGVFTPSGAAQPAGTETYRLPGDDAGALAPVDAANVCVNVDDAWFDDHGLTPPRTLDDLLDPRYRDLFVTPGATTSSPGLAFLLTTIAAYGEGWQDYWKRLLDNGARVVNSWSDAYEVDFTAGGGKGDRPIVLSYDSSPAFTTDGRGGSTTHALLDTCFRQVEYVGELAGAANPDGARAVVEWMQSPAVQKALPDSMYVVPVLPDTPLPPDWAKFAVPPTKPYTVDPAQITAQRDTWLREWNDLVGS